MPCGAFLMFPVFEALLTRAGQFMILVNGKVWGEGHEARGGAIGSLYSIHGARCEF